MPPFLGSHPAMDFLNTRPTPRGVPRADRRRGVVCRGLQDAQLLQATAARKLRRRFGAAALAAAAGRGSYGNGPAPGSCAGARRRRCVSSGARRLNRLLARARCYPEMVRTIDGFQVTERWRIDSADALIAVVAAPVASLVATEPPALVKRCAGPGCTLWFVDRTKAHGRLFCSATACGNRAKVAAFRERQRGGGH